MGEWGDMGTSNCLLLCGGACGVRGRGAYFAWFLRVWYFCLGASRIVILKENGIVNGVVKEYN